MRSLFILQVFGLKEMKNHLLLESLVAQIAEIFVVRRDRLAVLLTTVQSEAPQRTERFDSGADAVDAVAAQSVDVQENQTVGLVQSGDNRSLKSMGFHIFMYPILIKAFKYFIIWI